MGAADYILIGIICLCLFFAVRKVIRDRKNGRSCGCGCGNPNCTACKKPEPKTKKTESNQ